MRKIGTVIICPPDMELTDYCKMLRDIGFESCFVGDDREACAAALDAGLEIDNMHLPFDGINEMWKQGMSGDKMLKRLTDGIDICAEFGIPKAVVHLSSGDNAPHINDLGASRYDKLIKYAMSKNVKLAFENLRKLANVAFIMEKYRDNDYVGFCWDTGHEGCYTYGKEFMPLFGDRLICVHLQDNFCIKNNDQHLLPYDGTVGFDRVVKYLKNSPYDGPVMLEVFKRPGQVTGFDGYDNLTLREYYEKAYDVAEKIRDLL